MTMRKPLEKLMVWLIKACGYVSGFSILLIVLFLFSEAAGLFYRAPVEDETIIAVGKGNEVTQLTDEQLKKIFDGEIMNWNELGGKDEGIQLFRVDDMVRMYPQLSEAELLDSMPFFINRLYAQHSNLIGYFPKVLLNEDFEGTVVTVAPLTLFKFIGGSEWIPDAKPANIYGALPLISGTLWVSLLAILIALPLGLSVAIYMAELANQRIYHSLKTIIELLAGIPSVVYGFFGLVVIVPFIQETFSLPVGETALAGSIVLAIMALPTIISISEESIRSTPRSVKEASYALGASHWQTIYEVILPYSIRGIAAAAVLGIGRAIGETMAVLMVTGNAALIPTGVLQPVRTIPATIAAELGESTQGGLHFKSLFALGCILFLITLLINLSVEYITARGKKHHIS